MQDFLFNEDRLGWLTLASFSGFGSRTLAKLRQLHGTHGAKALRVSATQLAAWGHTLDNLEYFADFRRDFSNDRAVEQLQREDIRFILIDDPDYPPLLRQISDPPQALFVRGTLPDPTATTLAIVGTRSCTSYGRQITRHLAHDIAGAGVTIVSGLALGIDTIAHEAMSEAGATGIAVLGTGIDDASLYPRGNVRLAHQLISEGSAVVSEFPPGTESLKHHFPLRNRIIAGLARATLVTEAALDSGSLITAHLALSYNRDVFAVPGQITSHQSTGTNRLISQGAMVCTSAQDVLLALQAPGAPVIPLLRVGNLPEADQRLLAALDEPQRINDLAQLLKTNIRTLQQRITTLELKGFLEMQSGQFIARSRLITKDP